jgi:hypothetical protein
MGRFRNLVISELAKIVDLARLEQTRLTTIESTLAMVDSNVQALIDAVTANAAAATTQSAEIVTLKAQLAAVVPGAPIDADDLAAIVASVNSIHATTAAMTAAAAPAVAAAAVVAAPST